MQGDGRGPEQVWFEVNVFSQILQAGAVSSVTGRRGDSGRKGVLDGSDESVQRSSHNSVSSPFSPSPVCSLWTIYFFTLSASAYEPTILAAIATTPLCPPVLKKLDCFLQVSADSGSAHKQSHHLFNYRDRETLFLPRGMHIEGRLLSPVYLVWKNVLYIMVITKCAERHSNHTSFQLEQSNCLISAGFT